MSIELYAQILATYSAIVLWVFVIVYATIARWWTTEPGRAVMLLCASLALLLTLVSTSYLFGEYPGRNAVRALVYTTLPVTVTVLLIALVRRLLRTRRGEH